MSPAPSRGLTRSEILLTEISLLRNPFVIDRPLGAQDPFYGRDALFRRLQDDLLEGRRLFAVFGKRRIGKTSFINQLDLRLGGRYHIQRIDWKATPPEPASTREQRHNAPIIRAPLWRLSCGITQALGQPAPAAPTGALLGDHDRSVSWLRGVIASALDNHADQVQLFCLDALQPHEFSASQGWAETLAVFSAISEDLPQVALLLVVEGRAEECALPLDDLPIRQLVLGGLSAQDSEDLLMLLTHGAIHFDPESLRRIHVLSGGEPLFVQHFGRILFERRQRIGWVSLPDVDQAAEQIVQDAAPEFAALWDTVSPVERVVLCIFAERVGNQGLGTVADVTLHLRRMRAHLPEGMIQEVLNHLVQRDILEELGGRTFRVRNGLFFQWMKRTQSASEAVRRAPGVHQSRQQAISPRYTRRIDWVALALWSLAIVLAVAVAWVWHSRETHVTWTATPTAVDGAPAARLTLAAPLPMPERGVIPGAIVYIAKESPEDKWAIYRMRADGSDPVRLTHSDANDTAPVSSPDGRRIAFVSDRDGNREVYVMSADGADQQNLTRHPAEDWTPTWSPDGKRLAFASFRDGNWELYVMDADGGNVRRLTRHSAADYSPSWSPDGSRLAFVSDRDRNLEVYIMELEGGAMTRLTNDPSTDQAPSWSHDGQQILWESYRTGNMEIYAAALDGSNLRNLSQDAYADDHGATWSPWGRYVAWYTNRDKGWDIYRLDTQTGERANLTMSPVLEQWPHWGR